MTEPARPRPRKGGGAVRASGTRYAVEVVVDGRKLALKEFLHDLIGGAALGLIEGLRDVQAPQRVRIDVVRK